jgi:WD40 repeat protein/serine/threonine protein kinase
MNSTSAFTPRTQTSVAQQLAQLWQQGKPPEVRHFLAQAGMLSAGELLAVLRVDQRQHWLKGEPVPAEHYLEQYPGLQADLEKCLELVYGEYLLREELGQVPSLEEFQQRFPQYRSRLKQQIDLHRALESGTVLDLPGDGGSAGGAVRSSKWDAVGAYPAGAGWPVVPGYEIVGELGRGGMGVVYKAWQPGVNRLVALKMVLHGAHAGSAELARFRTEAEAVGRLQHPNIVQIYEVSQQAGRPFFALEYIDGTNLARQLDGKPQPARVAARLIQTLARAVHHVHQRGIVHRDLTPRNVLLTADGTPKITDFGLAKLQVGGPFQTESGSILGTPCYMAPEQAAGKTHEIGPATDIYALGAILYEMLTGRPPFLAETPFDTVLQVRTSDPVPPRRLLGKIPRDLETICLKCLHKEPRKRYASALDLADDLRRYLQGEPIQARPVPLWERALKLARRRPGVAFLSVAVLLLTVLGFSLVTSQWVRVDRERKRAEEARRQALRNAVGQAMVLAQVQGERGDVDLALLSYARCLALVPEEDADLRRVIRTNLRAWAAQLHPLKVCLAHRKPITCTARSPGGRLVVTGSEDGTARLWRADTGRAAGAPLRHHGPVRAVTLSRDGRLVLTGSEDGTARLWRADTGRPFGPALRHASPVAAVAFHPSGRLVLTAAEDGALRFWAVATGRRAAPALPRQTEHVAKVAFSPDGRFVLANCGQVVRLWETATGTPCGEIQHDQRVRDVAFSPDSRLVVTGSDDKTAWLWNLAGRRPVAKLTGHQGWVRAVAFSPDSKYVLTGSHDQTVQLWDARTGAPLGVELRHRSSITDAAFSPDGKTILTGCGDGTARLWDVATRSPRGSPLRHRGTVEMVAFLDGRTVLTRSEHQEVRLWKVSPGGLRPRAFPSALDGVKALVTSRDGRLVLSGSLANGAQFWDAATGDDVGLPILPPSDSETQAVALSPHGRLVLTGTWNPLTRRGEAQLWDANTNNPLGRPLVHPGPVWAVAFSPDGETILTGCSGPGKRGEARLWQTATGKRLGKPLEHGAPVLAVAFSPDGKTVATASQDRTARLWVTATGRPAGPALRHEGWVTAVAFSPDGTKLLTGCRDGMARLWQVSTGRLLGAPLFHGGEVFAVAFSPKEGGRTVLTGGVDRAARLWDVATGRPIGPALPHRDRVNAVAFLPDGQTFLTGSEDRVGIRSWDMPVPLAGGPERIILWTQVRTGVELDTTGVIRVLDEPTWRQRRARLHRLGGPPLP